MQQERTWTLKLTDGSTYEGLSRDDAVLALARLTYGVEPVSEAKVERLPLAPAYKAPLAA